MHRHNNQLAAKECYDSILMIIPRKMNTIINEIVYVKETAKETLPEGKHIIFLQAGIPLDTMLVGS